jgi:hypothetical protein
MSIKICFVVLNDVLEVCRILFFIFLDKTILKLLFLDSKTHSLIFQQSLMIENCYREITCYSLSLKKNYGLGSKV